MVLHSKMVSLCCKQCKAVNSCKVASTWYITLVVCRLLLFILLHCAAMSCTLLVSAPHGQSAVAAASA